MPTIIRDNPFSIEMVSFYDRVIDVIPVNQFPKTSQMPCRKRIGDLDRTNIPANGYFSSENVEFLVSQLQFGVMLFTAPGCSQGVQETIVESIPPLLEKFSFGTLLSCFYRDRVIMSEYGASMQDAPLQDAHIDHEMSACEMKTAPFENILLSEGKPYKAGMLLLARTYSPEIYVGAHRYLEYRMRFSTILMDALKAAHPMLHGCVMLTLTGSRKREHVNG